MNVLFVCNQGKHRSKTAALLFKDQFDTDFVGLFSLHPLTEKQLEWADLVVVMEDFQRKEIANRFPKHYLQKQIISFDVPDVYSFNQPALISLLKQKAELLQPLIKLA